MRTLTFILPSTLALMALSGCVIRTEPGSVNSPSHSHHHSSSNVSSSGSSRSSHNAKSAPAAKPSHKAAEPTADKVPIVTGTPFGRGMLKHALRGSVFFIAAGTRTMPDLDRMRPRGLVFTTELDVSVRDMREGFPELGDRKEWFAIRYEGEFVASTRGVYDFRLISDDGSILTIDDKVVINNDGAHPPTEKRGSIGLAPGDHKIRLDYFQGASRAIALQLFASPPGGRERTFNTTSPL